MIEMTAEEWFNGVYGPPDLSGMTYEECVAYAHVIASAGVERGIDITGIIPYLQEEMAVINCQLEETLEEAIENSWIRISPSGDLVFETRNRVTKIEINDSIGELKPETKAKLAEQLSLIECWASIFRRKLS